MSIYRPSTALSQPNRRAFLRTAAGAAVGAAALASPLWAADPLPNIVFILADDLGYGDVGVYGSKIPTPNLNRMAREGVRCTEFYSSSPVCSPSRAALMTGRYQTRVGIPGVLFPNQNIGIPDTETTIAQALKTVGYDTMCVGKWHLGDQPPFLPTMRGFDEFYGLLYSNDMSPLSLMHNRDVVEQQATLATLTPRYTDQAVNFISRTRTAPFFLYMPHTFPHIPLAASDKFRGVSGLGLYGDAVQEIDWSVGQIIVALKKYNLDDNTLIIFTSDNGPWYQGSAGRLRGRKGDTYEGGMREPFIARWPGRLPKNLVLHGMASMLDVFPTLASLTGAALPAQPLDGVNIWPLLNGTKEAVDRDVLLYFDSWQIQCARLGRWKLHISRYNSPAWAPEPPEGRMNLPLARPELYDIEGDVDESYDLAGDNPTIVADILKRVNALLVGMPDQVRSCWRDTMATQVVPTPAGAWPVKK